MKKMVILVILTIALVLASISCMGQRVDNSTVNSFSLNKYLGTWYEIARFDHVFEKGMTNTTASYTMQDDGSIEVINSGLKNDKIKVSRGKAKTTDQIGLLRVSFFGPFYSDYRVLMVTDDYRYALVGSKGSNYLWILSRTPDIPEDTLQTILDEASKRGYKLDNLIWVKQKITK